MDSDRPVTGHCTHSSYMRGVKPGEQEPSSPFPRADCERIVDVLNMVGLLPSQRGTKPVLTLCIEVCWLVRNLQL